MIDTIKNWLFSPVNPTISKYLNTNIIQIILTLGTIITVLCILKRIVFNFLISYFYLTQISWYKAIKYRFTLSVSEMKIINNIFKHKTQFFYQFPHDENEHTFKYDIILPRESAGQNIKRQKKVGRLATKKEIITLKKLQNKGFLELDCLESGFNWREKGLDAETFSCSGTMTTHKFDQVFGNHYCDAQKR